MHVTHVSIRPTEAAENAGRPALTPELLAASGARYSRNNEGLESILSKIDSKNLDKSVDSIFRMIDYGHQSIADMVPVSMFIDGISLWLAYYVWTLCPTAGGQESSTRYLKLTSDDLIDPNILGIPEAQQDAWRASMTACFDAYHQSLAIWEDLAARDPDLARIPRRLLDDPSDKSQKQVARMKRNYGFDRARYFLPLATSTNMMMIMSARGWVQLCQALLSHALPEANALGTAIRQELELCAPRMLRHAKAQDSMVSGLTLEFARLRDIAAVQNLDFLAPSVPEFDFPSGPSLDVMGSVRYAAHAFEEDLQFHDNRYAWIGPELKRTTVRFAWDAVSMAEIRDLNRHRTGNKYCPLVPQGFYAALDQLPDTIVEETSQLMQLADIGREASYIALRLLQSGEPHYVYSTVLGTQFPFEHVTTADKFIYEAELRTGTGSHYRYAKHLHDVLELWYARYPETRGLILEGSAEPE